MASELGYRVYRLRRLIGVCLGLVAFAVALGVGLLPGAVTAAQVAFGCGLFSLFAVAQLAMIVIWPADAGGPLAYALGLVPVLGVGLPLGAAVLEGQGGGEMLIALAIVFGPLVWLVATPVVGGALLWPLDKITRRDVRLVRHVWVPLDLNAALALMAFGPDQTGPLAVDGPVGWDGFWEQTQTRLAADEATGMLQKKRLVVRLRLLDSDATSQGVMAIAAGAGGQTAVIHQHLATAGAGTRVTRRFQIEKAAVGPLLTAWLMDGFGDAVTAEVDAATGRVPRALAYLPQDSMWASLARFMKWGEPAP